MPEMVYHALKYFGSGVILATAFIHVCPVLLTVSETVC